MADEIDELYALPLGEFTPARNELEKRLRKEGQRDDAAEVKALRKPTVPAWALNQVARRHAKDVEALIENGRRVGSAQDELLGGGDRKALDRATAEQRELTKQLVRAAVTIGDEAGTGTGAAFEEKVGATLRAAAADDEVAAQLAAGRLEREQEAVGLLGFGAVAETTPKRSGGGKRRAAAKTTAAKKPADKKTAGTKKADDGAAREAAAERRRAEAQERKRLRALETAQKAEGRARKTAEAAEKATAKERKTAERAVGRLKKAEAEEEAARAKLEEAAAEVERLDREGADP